MSVLTFVFDLDGVIYRGRECVPGAAETVTILKACGHQVYYFTNNSTKTRRSFVEKLSAMGIPADEDHIMTSSYATALYLLEEDASGRNVYMIGEEGLRYELETIGMNIISDAFQEKADYVVAGLDREFTYGKLMHAQQAIFRGAEFIATNKDSTFPAEGGLITPGGGSLIAAIEVAAGVQALTIAKPELPAMLELMRVAGASPETTVVVGDRLETDILVGRRAGTQCVLVLTGIATEEQALCAPPEMRPDCILPSVREITSRPEFCSQSVKVGTERQ